MICFSGAMLIYAGIMAVTKDLNMLQRRYRESAEMKDKKAYAVKLAKILAITAAAPALGGLVGFLSPLAGSIVIIAALPLCIWLGVHITRNDNV